METTKTKQLMTPSFVFENNYIFPSITFQVTTRENSSNENYTSFWRPKSSGSFKGQTFQLREPEYRRLITSTCGKLIYRFNDQVELLTTLYDAIESHSNLFRIIFRYTILQMAGDLS